MLSLKNKACIITTMNGLDIIMTLPIPIGSILKVLVNVKKAMFPTIVLKVIGSQRSLFMPSNKPFPDKINGGMLKMKHRELRHKLNSKTPSPRFFVHSRLIAVEMVKKISWMLMIKKISAIGLSAWPLILNLN